MADGNNLFQLEIITPDRVFYQGEAFMVEFTAEDGDIGVYKNHIPLTTVIAPGILNIKEAQGEKQAALHAGFAQILPEKVTILAEVAEWPDEIDKNRAEEAKKRAEERLQSHAAGIDVARAEAALKKALIRLNIGK
ncbi:MAG: ATP synthase F1 subunit epsilon [Lachnospiraceae bacterium]|jgi:F-type H+-transporting ATPase subunit epsilon|nr:ATP synthase F1 subunit epsilon [Lachnospiraceae bacterium]